MPRKYFRKYLPSHESVRNHKYLGKLARFLRHPNLWHLNRHSVSGGVAVGLFSGLVPGPLQMLTALILAIPLRRNLPVALLMTLYTNPFTIVPLYLLAYAYGRLLLPGEHASNVTPFEFDWSDFGASMAALGDWAVSLGKPLAVGLVALAITLAVIGYIAVQIGWRIYVVSAWRARSRRRKA